jgi:hypothetical protein
VESENDSKIIGVRDGFTYRVNTSPENNTPEKIQRRLRAIFEIAIDILAREGKLRSGLTTRKPTQTLS